MIINNSTNSEKQRKYVQLTYEQKEKIYTKDRHKFSNKAIAKYYGIHEKSVKKIIDKFEENREIQKLSNQEIMTIVEEKASKEVVQKVVEARAELITAEAKLKELEAKRIAESNEEMHKHYEFMNDQHSTIYNKAFQIVNNTLAKLQYQNSVDTLGNQDPSDTALAINLDKLMNAINKLTDINIKQQNAIYKYQESLGMHKSTGINIDNRSLTLTNSKQTGHGSDSLVDYQFAFPVLQDGFKTVADADVIADHVVEAEIVG